MLLKISMKYLRWLSWKLNRAFQQKVSLRQNLSFLSNIGNINLAEIKKAETVGKSPHADVFVHSNSNR